MPPPFILVKQFCTVIKSHPLWRQDQLFREIFHWISCANLKSNYRYLNIHTLDSGHAVNLHVFPALLTGATLYLGDIDKTSEILQIIKEKKINVMSALPSQYLMLAEEAQRVGTQVPELTNPFCGGAYLDEQVILKSKRWLDIYIKRIYGSTEFGMILANFSSDLQVSCGMYPVGDVNIILEPLDLKEPDIGEVIAISNHSGSGYFPLQKKLVGSTNYRTGDIAKRLKDDSLIILGRRSDALLTLYGIQFLPAIESSIAEALLIKHAIAMVDEGSNYISYLVLQLTHEVTSDMYLIIKGIFVDLGVEIGSLVIIEQIPLMPTGKPDRYCLKKLIKKYQTDNVPIIYIKD